MQLPVNITSFIQILTYNVLNSPFKWSLSVWPVDKYDRHRKYFSCDCCSRRCIVMYQKNFFLMAIGERSQKRHGQITVFMLFDNRFLQILPKMYLFEFKKKNFHIAVPNFCPQITYLPLKFYYFIILFCLYCISFFLINDRMILFL